MITKRVQYRYDSVRNKIGMTDADGGLHTYTYDVMRRLTGVINPLGERTTYAYDLNGRRTSVQLANGTRTSYVYDVCSRVQSVHTLKSDDSTVSKFEYEYDGNGRRTSVLEADGSRVTWTYDRISQVTSEWRTGTNPYRHTFTYDSVGNRTLKIEDGDRTTLVYDACNQLLTSEDNSGTTTFTYDGNGNQTVVQKPSGDRTTQVWDYENRLVKTIQPSGGITSMAYDADGLRLKLEEPTRTKLFVWDDQNYLAETDAAGATETAFTTEPSTYGGLISHRKAGASTTYHFDALGSTRALTDESEAVLERYNYTAFGTLLGSPTLLTPFLWGGMVGYYWDAALATQYIRARHYQPMIARWISLDPIGFAGGDANLFRYVGNSPTSGSTGRRVRLSPEAYGNWQLAIARSVLSYLTFTGMHEGRQRRFVPSQLDPSGRCNASPTVAKEQAGKKGPVGSIGVCQKIKTIPGPWKLVGVLPSDMGEPVTSLNIFGNTLKQIETVACMYAREELGCYKCPGCCFAVNKAGTGRKDGKGYGSIVVNVTEHAWNGSGVEIGVGDIIGGLPGDIISVVGSGLDLDLEIGLWGFEDDKDEEMAMKLCPTVGDPFPKKAPDNTTSVGLPKFFVCENP